MKPKFGIIIQHSVLVHDFFLGNILALQAPGREDNMLTLHTVNNYIKLMIVFS